MTVKEEKPKSLMSKLSQIMGDLKDIPKTGYNKAQNYPFRKADDVDAAVSKELAKHGIILWPNLVEETFAPLYQTTSGMTMWIAKVVVEYQFIDGETGEVTPLSRVPGTGADTGDKGHAKAMTMSKKYFLSQVFLIGGNDDPEADEKVDKAAAASGASSGPTRITTGSQAGVQRGGKSATATAAQVREVASLSKKLGLDATSVVPVIIRVLGLPEDEAEAMGDLRTWLGSLPAKDIAILISAMQQTIDATVDEPVDEAGKTEEVDLVEAAQEAFDIV